MARWVSFTKLNGGATILLDAEGFCAEPAVDAAGQPALRIWTDRSAWRICGLAEDISGSVRVKGDLTSLMLLLGAETFA